MAITTGVNNIFKQEVMLGEHDLNTNTLKVALVSSSQNVSAGDPNTYTSITGELASGNGYTTGGATLASVTVTQVSSSGVVDGVNMSSRILLKSLRPLLSQPSRTGS